MLNIVKFILVFIIIRLFSPNFWKLLQLATEYSTYKSYLQQPGNEGKNFNDYLLDYFQAKAVPYILRALNNDSLGLILRITNDLPSVHPELLTARIADQCITAVDFMDVEQQYKAQAL